MRKVTILGGGGVRTPLLLYGLAQAQSELSVDEVVLFDLDEARTNTIARLGQELLRQFDRSFEIRVSSQLEPAIVDADFIVNSVRVGGIESRARDERIAIEHGFAGQETTGPAGAAMALRTLPVTLEHAKLAMRVAPKAWFINFTNPAGLITQALLQNTDLRVIGICDTPAELFHKIAQSLRQPYADLYFDYLGLNHLGWVRQIRLRGEDITDRLLSDKQSLRSLHSSNLFDPALIQALGLIPTEYVFFYYSQTRAYENQFRAGASRGQELKQLNAQLFRQLEAENSEQALTTYRRYLMRRNASYMKLEGEAGSLLGAFQNEENPFETATGYHKIALAVMSALLSETPHQLVINVMNQGSIDELEPDDVVEVPCDVSKMGAQPRRAGRLPDAVRGLVQSVKRYERTLIEAALRRSRLLGQLALMENPIIGEWEIAGRLLEALCREDPGGLGYLQ